jgi:hypothetical protein
MRAGRGAPIIWGMSGNRRSPQPLALGGAILAVILVNVLLRVVPLPDLDLPSIALPDLPGWVDAGADAIHTVVRVKNWLVAGLVVVVIAGLAIEGFAKSREGGKPE